jgi:hypothetical protein
MALSLEISITAYELQMLLQLTVACSLEIVLKPWVWEELLSFHSGKPCSLAPFLELTRARWQFILAIYAPMIYTCPSNGSARIESITPRAVYIIGA